MKKVSADDGVRHSKARTLTLITDPAERAQREAANSLRQVARMNEVILSSLSGDRPFRLRPSLLLDLNREAIDGLDSYAGNYRPTSIEIGQSKHQPPQAFLVPTLVEDMCEYVNDHWETRTAIHLAAYVLWRVNWIHPFSDGNGRTARATSYIVLCARSNIHLPGTVTIPDQIIARRKDYYEALEQADEIFREYERSDGEINPVEELEKLLTKMLANQILSSYTNATGEQLI